MSLEKVSNISSMPTTSATKSIMSCKLSVIKAAIFSSFDGVPAACASRVLETRITVSLWPVGQSVARTLIYLPEFCYRVQYPVRNGRNRGDPFSMRQIGICQRSHGPQDSTWIILQPSLEVLSRLERTIEQSEFFSTQQRDPMSLHLIFLEYQSVNWDDYVEHLRLTLEPLVRLPSGQSMLYFEPNTVSDRRSTLLQGRPQLQISRLRLCCRF